MSALSGRLGELFGLSPATVAGLSPYDAAPAAPGPAPAAAGGTINVPDQIIGTPYDSDDEPPPPRTINVPDQIIGTPYDDVATPPDAESPSAVAGEGAPNVINATPQTIAGVPGQPGYPFPSPGAPRPVPGPGGSYMVPAHWQNKTREYHTVQGMEPEALQPGYDLRKRATGYEEKAAERQLEAANMAGQADSAYAASRAAADAFFAREFQRVENRKHEYIQGQQQKLAELRTQAQRKVNPDDLFEGRPGARVAAALMMGLGQFAAMWRGGENAAMKIVNDAIRENMESQKFNINNARNALADQQSEMSRNLALLEDDKQAALALKVQHLDQVSSMLEARKIDAKLADNDAAYLKMKAAIDKEQAGVLDEFARATSDKTTIAGHDAFAPAQSFGPPGRVGDEERVPTITLPDGTTVAVPEKTEASMIERLRAKGELIELNKDILKLRQEYYNLPATDIAKKKEALERLTEKAFEKVDKQSIANGQGVVRDAELRNAMAYRVGALEGVGPKYSPLSAYTMKMDREAADAMIRDQNDRYERELKGMAAASGGGVYVKTYSRDKNGHLVPTGHFTGKDVRMQESLPPKGSEPMKKRQYLPTAGEPLGDEADVAPVAGALPEHKSGRGKRKKGEDD